MYLDVLLENLKDSCDVLFIQEPPWQIIRMAPSTLSPEGDEVIGAPKHPSWMTIVRPSGAGADERPRTMAYVSTKLNPLRPSMRRDLIDHRDVLVLSLFAGGRTVNLMNVYSDDRHTAIFLLAEKAAVLPPFAYIGGDFNCHSKEWDPEVPHHRTVPILLLETAAKLGTERTSPINPGPTFISRNPDLHPSVIDLIFLPPSEILIAQPMRDLNLQGLSDHILIGVMVDLGTNVPEIWRRSLKPASDEEKVFVTDIMLGI